MYLCLLQEADARKSLMMGTCSTPQYSTYSSIILKEIEDHSNKFSTSIFLLIEKPPSMDAFPWNKVKI